MNIETRVEIVRPTIRSVQSRGHVALEGLSPFHVDFAGSVQRWPDGRLTNPNGRIIMAGYGEGFGLALNASRLASVEFSEDADYKIATLTSAPVSYADMSDYVPGDLSTIVHRVVIAEGKVYLPLRRTNPYRRGLVSLDLFDYIDRERLVQSIPRTALTDGSTSVR